MKKIEELMGIKFNTKPTYADDEEYIEAKIKTYDVNKKGSKKYQKKKYHINFYQ